MKIIFRSDGSRDIGMGHVVRCLTLADELKKRYSSCEIVFITKYEEGQGIMQKRGYTVARPESDEVTQIKELGGSGALLVTDFLDTGDAYISRIKSNADIRVVAIDNNTRLKNIGADVVINANVFDEGETKIIGSTRYFMGPKYVILRREFQQAHERIQAVRDEVQSILVLAGGGDLAGGHLILNSVEALDRLDNDICIRLVIGPTFPYRDQLSKLVDRRQGNFVVSSDPPNLTELMNGADMAVTAAGTVLYELASLGIPSIAVPTVTPKTNHQEDIAHNFETHGACINLRRAPGNELLLEKVMLLMRDEALRQRLSDNGKRLVDARGLDRALGMISEISAPAG